MTLDLFIASYNNTYQSDIARLSQSQLLINDDLNQVFRFSKSTILQQTFDAIICEKAVQQVIPVSAISMICYLGEFAQLPKQSYLQAYPVMLQIQRDSVYLSHAVVPNAQEYADLSLFLSQFFAEDGLTFITSQTGQYWHVQFAQPLSVQVKSLMQKIGRQLLPDDSIGKDASKLNQLQNMAQMLLHEHPINTLREQENLPIMNGLWFSGGGNLPEKCTANVDMIFGKNDLLQGLASLTQLILQPVSAFNLNNIDSQQRVMAEIDANNLADSALMATIVKLLKNNKINSLNVYFAHQNQTVHLQIKPIDFLKFWRPKKSLADFLNTESTA